MKSLQIRVHGKVQGVFFRANTKDKADELGLNGTVQNCSNGTVLIQCAGNDEAVDQLVKWCHHGPPRAKVENVETEEISKNNFKGFKIIR